MSSAELNKNKKQLQTLVSGITEYQQGIKEYEKNKQIRTRKSPGVREIRRTKKPRPRRTEGVN